jgi:ectoine hydroxylase-related dioxygenase (phytanoyl-CoA dioxygenase family)
MLWKPMGAKSVGYHRDNQFLAWYQPQEMLTCWNALDDTSEVGGTLEFAKGSHRWAVDGGPLPQFHAPEDYRAPVKRAAEEYRQALDHGYVEVSAGSASFHHGWTWHGSGPNHSFGERRALVVHCASSEATFNRSGFTEGNGPIYSRYAHLGDDVMDENYFPITWAADGHRTPGL